MTDPVDVYPWQMAMSQAMSVCKAHGLAIVDWPSGRRTVEEYAGNALISHREVQRVASAAFNLRAAKEENLRRSMESFREETLRQGWWIRHKHGRPQARRVAAVEWVKPSAYRGPAPSRGGLVETAA